MLRKKVSTTDLLGKQDGFSMIEMLIVLTLFIVVLALTLDTSSLIFKQSAQQAKGAESQMESVVGLEMLRRDLEHAGCGLPWSFQNTSGFTYNEASVSPAINYNSTAGGVATGNVPTGVSGGRAAATHDLANYVLNKSDYLVIRSVVIGMDTTSQKLSYMMNSSTAMTRGTSDDLSSTDHVIVLRPQVDNVTLRQLVMNGAGFSTTFGTAGGGYVPGFTVQAADLIYGLTPNGVNPRMPFNRADYYVRSPSGGLPSQCNGNTGVLYKSTVNHSDGKLTEYPLLDCVAYMYVVLNLDMDEDGTPGTFSTLPDEGTTYPNVSSTSEGATPLTVQTTLGSPDLLRKRLKEIRVFILTQTGLKDTSYTYPSTTIALGSGTGLTVNFDLSSMGNNWQNYRWKVYTLVVKPKNLF